jgi:hypothetical protein
MEGMRLFLGYNIGMRLLISLWLLLLFITSDEMVLAQNNSGAYLEPTGDRDRFSIGWLLPPYATLSIVDEAGDIYASYIDSGTGRLITAMPLPDEKSEILAVFYSDGTGLSSRIPVDFSQESQTSLLPPTIYSRKLVKALGFIGNTYPTSQIEVEVDGYTNEKTTLVSLADNTGEWQLSPVELTPGKYQARARAIYAGQVSAWSQIMYIEILTPFDQAIEDFGNQTRSSVEDTINRLPDPLKSVARTVDDRSDILSKFLLPTLLTLTTVAQSGILFQNLFYLLYQAFLGLLQLLGLVKKRLDTGVIYDAVTKKPIARAIIRLYESTTHKLVETDVTSAEGTFSFLPPEGFYYLRASKPGFIYPTRLIVGNHDGRYSRVYSGGDLEISASRPVISVAVPLDPEAFAENWHMRLSRTWQRWFEPMNQWFLLFGFFLAILSYSRIPSRLNFVILLLYLMALVYYLLQGKTFNRDYGMVVTERGKPISGVELNLIDIEFNRLVSRRVSDGKGRYQFLVPPGKYQIKVVTPGYSLVKSAKKAYQGEEVTVTGDRGQSKRLMPRIVIKNA